MSNKEKNKTKRYNKYYLLCTSTIVYYNYFYRQRQRKLETAAEVTMACAKHSPQAQESLVGGNLAARNQMSCGRRISCHQRKDTADHRLFMGQFLISNKDRGTIVTPSQPYTGTEVQVQNTHRDEFKTHGTISCFTENNAKKEKKRGGFSSSK